MALCLRRTRIPIYLHDSKLMNRLCRHVPTNQLNSMAVRECVQRMRTVLRRHPDRPVGISAPQVGFSLRIMAFRDHSASGRIMIVANPEINPVGDKTCWRQEGCLSYPNLFVQTRRWSRIRLAGYNYHSNEIICKDYTNLRAAIIQHELDHLNAQPWPPKGSTRIAFFRKE